MKNYTLFLITIIILIMAVIGASFTFASDNNDKSGSIVVYAGAGFSELGDDLVKAFNEKYPNIEVNMRYGGSGELFTTMETQKNGDVFFPAAYKYMGEAVENGYVENGTVKNVTKNIPVIVVQSGNPKNITGVEDLARNDVKVGLGEAEGPAIGKSSQEILNKSNVTVDPIVTTTTVNQLVTYITSGEIDATIIWKAMTTWSDNQGKLEVIEIPDEQNKISTIPIAVTTFAEDKDSAHAFVDFVTEDDSAHKLFEKWGYELL
ncbi:MAG: molybdate ABC transporter substrate-binding protein [Methanobrevibacter sp.]|uniref:molybdate ABC transporter substrate-binding protein n=1 Tax=Methanobrevibacter sp. TaxID=66852 RepID=UPI0025DEC4CF|nr:molybdate ABC transporter substrate-binding protein [Methanobrevibacter sp.]MBQ6098350.1 molybdate ABC transporter substrate-binding protein [Methanobrevibacter sp.]